ncbi:MAG: hypothetical protein JNK04_21640 [Myxococcales bacterium]|nr:hypothetical protein [Myxococcales bacterium]
MRWVDDSTFVAPRASIIDSIRHSLGSDDYASLRIAAALEHNCPLEDVSVTLEQRMSASEPRFVLSVCGDEHTYLELEGPVFVEVLPPRPAVEAAPPPTGLDTPTSADKASPSATPPSDPSPKEPKK